MRLEWPQDFNSKTANIAANTPLPISLTPGVQCAPFPSPSSGTLGQDSSSVVCASATNLGDVFEIKYKIWFRELHDNPFSPTQTFDIELDKGTGLTQSTSRSIQISFGDSTQSSPQPGQTLITKKVKILII